MAINAVMIAGLLCLPAPPLVFVNEARIIGSVVALSDVADVSVLPDGLRLLATRVPVARVRDGEQTLSSKVMASRARSAIPALASWLPSNSDHDVVIVAQTPDLPANTIRPRALPVGPMIEVGDRLSVVTRVGPVEVARDVQALQSAHPGQHLFVLTKNGDVLTAQVETRP